MISRVSFHIAQCTNALWHNKKSNYHKTMAFCPLFSPRFTEWGRNTHSHRGSRDTRRVKMCKCLEFPPIRQRTSAEPSLTTAKQTLVWPASLHWQVTKSFTNAQLSHSLPLLSCTAVCLTASGGRDILHLCSPGPSALSSQREGGEGKKRETEIKYEVIESSTRVQTLCVMW